jgi:Zn ribbon nucleic-acid-binding protein
VAARFAAPLLTPAWFCICAAAQCPRQVQVDAVNCQVNHLWSLAKCVTCGKGHRENSIGVAGRLRSGMLQT